jgi:tetratricopeptide (TPR) repeat protein
MAQGTLLFKLSLYPEAIRDLEEAVRILETQEDDGDANTVELAPLLSHLGMAFAEVGEYSKSLACFDRAVAIHRNSMNEEDLSFVRLARLLMNKGTALDKAGQYGEAAVCYDDGIKTWQLAINKSTTRLNSAKAKEKSSIAGILLEEISDLLNGMTLRFDLFRRSGDWSRAAVEIEKLLGLFMEYKIETVAKGLTRFFTELRDMSPLECENLYAALGEKEEIFRGIIESKSISFEFVDEDE